MNDARDMEAALKRLGFTVETVLNGSYSEMDNAVMKFKSRLRASRNTYGFFFYAGHGVQANGRNYLIPVKADAIRSEAHLREQAVSLSTILENMGEAGNELNIIVLDACRNNPFSWSRSGSRGLSVVSRKPSGSIIMYATAANAVAKDGEGRNGLFTTRLLNNLQTQGLSIYEVFDKTMGDVKNASGGEQHPEMHVMYSGANKTYLGKPPGPGTGTRPPVTGPSPGPQPPNPGPTPSSKAKDHFDRGKMFSKRGDLDSAILEFEKARVTYLEIELAYLSRVSKGLAYSKSERAEVKHAEVGSELAKAHLSRGLAYLYKRDYDRAIADFDQAIKLKPNYGEAYYNLGVAYERKGDIAKAGLKKNYARRLGYSPKR